MLEDDERPARIDAEQRRLVRTSLQNEVRVHSPYWRRRLEEEVPRSLRSPDDLAAFHPVRASDIDDVQGIVLRPSPETLREAAKAQPLPARLGAALGRGRGARRLLDPTYKPVHWLIEGGLPIGLPLFDLELVADLGRRWLAAAGVTPGDAIVSVVPPGPTLAFWQLVLGARDGGVPLAALAPDADPAAIAALGPTVLAGRPSDLVEVLRTLRPAASDGLRTILCLGRRLDPVRRARIEALAPGAAVLEAWAPPGVRSLWYQCRGGDGLHTWPGTELIELLDGMVPVQRDTPGQIVWTGLGWRGTTFVRLATGVEATMGETAACPACGRTSPRLRLRPVRPTAASILEAHAGVLEWQAERRRRPATGAAGLVVYFAPVPGAALADVLASLDEDLAATQYIVLEPWQVEARVAAAGGHRMVDAR